MPVHVILREKWHIAGPFQLQQILSLNIIEDFRDAGHAHYGKGLIGFIYFAFIFHDNMDTHTHWLVVRHIN